MNGQNQYLLNSMINNQLPTINAAIQGAIKSSNLDPWGQVAYGSNNLGSSLIGANANYNINKMSGLSSFSIDSLEIQTVETDPNDASKLSGHINMNASLKSNLSANVGGILNANSKNVIHNFIPSVVIGGTAMISGVYANASGSFNTSVINGKVCLDAIHLSPVDVNYGNTNVNINSLGFFNSLINPLSNTIMDLINGSVRNAISNAITPIIYSQINRILPQCQNI